MFRLRFIGSGFQRLACGLALVLAMVGQCLATESVEFDIQPRALKVGETTTLRITIRGENQAPAPNLPALKGFELAGTSSQQSFSIGPGGRESSVSHLYQLVAMEAGTFQVGPFAYQWEGRNYTLGPLSLTVVAGEAGTSPADGQQADFLFATLSATSTNPFVQQPIQLELALYWRELNIDREVALNGFDSTGLRLGGWQELPVTREVVREKVFEVRRFRCQAIPLTAGSFNLAPQLRVQILVRQSRSRTDPFFGSGALDDMFFGRFRAQATDVGVPPLALVIRDLPAEGKPTDFNGAVGSFQLQAQAQPRTVNVGEPVTVTLRITGHGNLDTVTAPALSVSDDFRRYDPKLVGQDAAAGQKTFEVVLMPKHAQATNLPAFSLAYFDPDRGRYEQAKLDPIPIQVTGQSATTRVIRPTQEPTRAVTLQSVGIDINHLKTHAPRWSRYARPDWPDRTPARALQALPLVAWLGAWWWARKRQRLLLNPVEARRRQAPRSARKALAAAVQALAHEPAPQFFEALWQLLTGYFGHRFNLSPGEVSSDVVTRRLLASGWSIDLVEEVRQLFEACELRRFGQADTSEEPMGANDQQAWHARLDRLVELLRICEKLP